MNSLCRFVPTRYSLRHGNYTASNSLCSWVLEGTTNLLDWVVLREHSNDSSLANPFVWASWTILQEKQVRSLSDIAPLLLQVTVCLLAAGAGCQPSRYSDWAAVGRSQGQGTPRQWKSACCSRTLRLPLFSPIDPIPVIKRV